MKNLINIARHFATDGEVTDVRPLGDGLINTTYLAETTMGEHYILQRINDGIFRDVDTLQQNLWNITNHIRRCLNRMGETDVDRKVLTPISTTDGRLYLHNDEGYWRMTRFIADSHTLSKVTPEMAEMTGRAFARFHAYFAEEDTPELKETIPDFHNIAFRIEQLREAAEADKAGRLKECHEETDALLARDEEMTIVGRLTDERELPKRTAHCDTKLNNILFDADGNILCVIDLDTTMPGYVLSDFGDFIRTAANTGMEDDPNLANVEVNMEIFRRFATGYVSEAKFLTPLERKLLPFGAKMLTYMQAVRFLTDYLNGDTYYKTEYADHNLVRTRAQMKLLESIDANFVDMESFIDTLSK